MSEVDFTIVTINYNNYSGLVKTIHSVQRVLNQRVEWVVVDGGSVDGSVELISKEKNITRYISEPDQGIYDAMNKGVKLASGKYIIFMNSGDAFHWQFGFELLPTSLELEGVIYGDCVRNVGDMYYLDRVKDKEGKWWLNGTPCHQSIFLPRQFLLDHPFSLQYKFYADAENMIKAFTVLPNHIKVDCAISIYEIGGISSAAVSSLSSYKSKNQELALAYGRVWKPFSKKFIIGLIKHFLLMLLGANRYYIASYSIKAFIRARDEKDSI
ncbi:glycosyltransferase [Hafnia alvei]|uniref:glycosyltransferase n=1 Tax=Hafnia alvei TaxID=569 RepID=UPI001F162E00|nr:glycosyltransferase [Hafnia alvei]MCE9873756.1 glycosyltransferase [Hafnia alvei]